jgi:uncharacterized SAM-binding protein YcdF (DUF218 family)
VTSNGLARLVWRLTSWVLVLVLAVTAFVAVRVWWVARQDDRTRSDAIVVLGASQYDGRPSNVFAARLGHAHGLFQDDVAPRLITVGGSLPGDRFTEAAAGKQWLVERGVPPGRVVAVEKGGDTLQSLTAVSRVMDRRGWDSVVVVTDPWHSLRARTMAEDVGLEAVTSPARSGPAVRTRATEVRYIARETLAYLYYWVFGESSESGPNAI